MSKETSNYQLVIGDGFPDNIGYYLEKELKKTNIDYDLHLSSMNFNQKPSLPVIVLAHGIISEERGGKHEVSIAGPFESTEAVLIKMGGGHLFSCNSGAGAEDLNNFPNKFPVIFHSGKKYETLSSMNVESIIGIAQFRERIKNEKGALPSLYDEFEFCLLTSPETMNFVEFVKGEAKIFKTRYSRESFSDNTLDRKSVV